MQPRSRPPLAGSPEAAREVVLRFTTTDLTSTPHVFSWGQEQNGESVSSRLRPEALERELGKIDNESVRDAARHDVVTTVNDILRTRGAESSREVQVFSYTLIIEAEYCHDAYEGLRRSGYGASANESDGFGPNIKIECIAS